MTGRETVETTVSGEVLQAKERKDLRAKRACRGAATTKLSQMTF